MSTPFSGLSAGFQAGPRTPEPGASFATAGNDAPPLSPPSPPRRMRLKRRAAPRLSAPTQNFLASVAAADVPIPSIEVPDHDESFAGMLGLQQHQQPLYQQQNFHQGLFATENMDATFLSVKGRTFSPPRTPAPGVAPSASALPHSRYPDWSIDSVFSSSTESSPDPECGSSSRPSTARSTQTSSSSLFSRFSQLSDDDHCLSPEDDAPNKFKFGPTSHLYELRRNSASGGTFTSGSGAAADGGDNAPSNQRRRARKPALTKAMSAHLWATYILYLQDPKVTPFRVGKSCVPPHGVLLRVAREAKRSWKGAKAMSRPSAGCNNNTVAAPEDQPSLLASTDVPTVKVSSADSVATTQDGAAGTKSGSSTPTATDGTAGGTFMEWPFTNAATRAHLRELCRLKAATPGGGARGLQYMSRSPTPFTQTAATATTRHRNMRATPDASNALSTAPSQVPFNAPLNAPFNAPSNRTAFPSSSFGTKDMALSLVLSTSETMQPHGPLAQLTRVGRDRAYSSYNASNSHSSHGSRSSHRPHRSLGSHLYHPSGPPPSFDTNLTAALGAAPTATSGEMFAPVPLAPVPLAPAADIPGDASFSERRRLGSPFTARSYGPSSSSSLAAVLGLSTANTRQTHTVGPRRSLQSPVRISRTSTQKSRRTKHLSQDLRRRPGLGTDFFTEPAAFSSFGFPLGPNEDSPSNMNAAQNDDPLSFKAEPLPPLTSSSSAPQLTLATSGDPRASEATVREDETDVPQCIQTAAPTTRSLGGLSANSNPFGGSLLGSAPTQPPARLGSPFALPETSTSFSFPNRLFQSTADLDMASASRPFATVQRVAHPKAVTGRTDLASRLAYLDQRLREINGRSNNNRRRSDSPA